jgi:hypothetical protein
MSRRVQSKGDCVFCGREMTRGGLSKHLASCERRREMTAVADSQSGGSEQTIYHLLVHDAYTPDFWLHLEVNGQATLTQIDRYLRAIWLECCDHLSQFSVGGWRGKEIKKSRRVEDVFSSSMALTHIYDFGTSSETLLKPVAARVGNPLTKHPIYLMARNNLPAKECAECGGAAEFYCVDCQVEKDEWIALCAACCDKHDHDEYGGPQPLVNSPRLGMCGYEGPADPPY